MWPFRDRSKPKVEYVETCPHCGSRRIEHKMGVSIWIMMGLAYVYECPDCGYRGINVGLSPLEPEAPGPVDDEDKVDRAS